ncbi:unnamed protein product [Notodromas monacha]|uniref:Novel acetylcholine receptor chaperone n=1 Tax=Notodromas monacha TaxID=399045 RepID=A0A7R9BR00_9CRUS|nr:unnamed protein product [Notodromas monacha]CAG0918725.1 unnamed protein product [Notodromas monacha]
MFGFEDTVRRDLQFTIYGVFGIAAGVLNLWLPETAGRPMPQTMSDLILGLNNGLHKVRKSRVVQLTKNGLRGLREYVEEEMAMVPITDPEAESETSSISIRARREFVKYTKVFPFGSFFDLKAKWYRRVFGTLEAVFGLLMAIIPIAIVKDVSNSVLLTLTLLMGYNHYAVSNQFEKFAPFLVFFFLLCCRLIISWQIRRKERRQQLREEAEKTLEEEKKVK